MGVKAKTPALALGAVAVLLSAAPAAAGAQRETARPDHGKLTPVLGALAEPGVAQAPAADQAAELSLPSRGPGSLLRRGDRILVNVRFAAGAARARDELAATGGEVLAVSSRYETDTVAVRPQRLHELARVKGVEGISEILTPILAGRATAPGDPPPAAALNTCQGAKTSEGDTQLRAAGARAQWDIDGAGVKVGVLSDSYAKVTSPKSAAQDVASGDLPGPGNPCGRTTPVQVLDDSASGADEGRAMAQIVHDLAPGSPLAVATAFTGDIAFGNNIRSLRNAGAGVIVDDVSYFNEPFFQDGPISVAVNDVTGSGVVYYSSAANNSINSASPRASFESPSFRNGGACPANSPTYATQCMDFDPGAGVDNTYGITVPNGRTVRLDLQWAQPWYGVSTDLDAYLYSASTGARVAQAESTNVHGVAGTTEQPFEFIAWTNNTGTAQNVNLAINRYTGTGGGDAGAPRLKFIFLGNGAQDIVPNEYVASNGTDTVGPAIYGHNGANNAMSTAAVPYNNSSLPEAFSSRGPVTHYFGPVSGTTPAPAISPLQLSKPDIAATDGGQNTFFGSNDGLNFRFYGTSAAAPHAAAVAALMRQLAPGASAAQVKAAQKSTAVAVGSFPVTAVGSGLIDAVGATSALTRTLSINKSGTGSGVVTSSNPAGISCGAVCTKALGIGQRITLSASPTAGSTFAGWSGGGCSGTGSCMLTMGGTGTTVTATFTRGPADTTPPDTIIESGPSGPTRSSTASFAFRATEPGSTFGCRLDGGAFAPCPSPRSLAGLSEGTHTFAVRATDQANNTDPTPATRTFTVDTRAPTISRLKGRIKGKKRKATIIWTAADPSPGTGIAATSCKLDGAGFAKCSSPRTYKRLRRGSHTFTVRVADRAGNVAQRSGSFEIK